MYLSYQFYKQPRHESAGREHGREVYWQDVNVVLLGTLDKAALAEFLQGPHFEVELHDRDRKVDNKKPKPCLFGENMDDDMINSVSLVAGQSALSISPDSRAHISLLMDQLIVCLVVFTCGNTIAIYRQQLFPS